MFPICSSTEQNGGTPNVPGRVTAARELVRLLTPLSTDPEPVPETSSATEPPVHLAEHAAIPTSHCRQILSAIQALVPTLIPDNPLFAAFHDGQVHDPLGGGSYAFQNDVIEPVLHALVADECLPNSKGYSHAGAMSNSTNSDYESGAQPSLRLPTRPIVVHAGAQPNNSPHAGTLVVFCYAFSLARGIRDRMQANLAGTAPSLPPVSVEITFVDTAPVKGQGVKVDGVQYQRSYRDVPEALQAYMADYEEVLDHLSTWSGISFTTAFQSNFFSQPVMPSLLSYIVANRDLLGRQLSPKYGTLALRAACPILGCGMAEKHGRLNAYSDIDGLYQGEHVASAAQHAEITFRCPLHGPHTICTSKPADVARLEANAPVRNLIRSMSHMLDTSTHHVRITGADYAGMYQEVFLYRPLAAWSAATGLAAGRTPHILYAPLIVDWSGAKLSKTLYIRDGGYEAMKLFGTDGLCSYAKLKSRFGGNSAEGLSRIWDEVQSWVMDPRKLFRSFSVDYLQRVIMGTDKQEDTGILGT